MTEPEAYILAALREKRRDVEARLFFGYGAGKARRRLEIAWLNAEIARRVVVQEDGTVPP